MLMVMTEANYDFIMNPGQKPGKSLLPGGNGMQQRIIVAAGGLVLLVVIALIVMSLLSSGGKEDRAQLVKIAQTQAEIIRVSQLGNERARQAASKNLAITTDLSLRSDQAELTAALAKQGIKISEADLVGGKNTKTDTALTAAEQSNQFDTVFAQTLRAQLTNYQKQLSQAYEAATSKALKTVLEKQFNNAVRLAGNQE